MARTQEISSPPLAVAEERQHGDNAPQPVRGLRDWLDHLAARDRLSVVKPNVDLRFELAAYAKRLDGRRVAFDRYETALVTNDVAVLDETFHEDARTIRYGGVEILYGFAEIAAFRAARSPVGLMRTISKTVITTYGRNFAVASTLFHRDTLPGKVGRQMQTWVRFPHGWRVVAAHVSVIDEASVWKPA